LVKNSGVISLRVTPSDAEVKLNDQIITEKSLEKPPGTYTLTVEKSGYLPYSETIVLERGKTVTINVVLEKNTGLLLWTVNPAGATVTINKEAFRGVNAAELAPGRYLVEVSAEGYDPQSESIEIKRGDKIQKAFTLVQQVGGLQFSIDPVDAQVELVRGTTVVEKWTGLKLLKNIPVGTYTVRARLSGYKDVEKPVTIVRDKNQVLEVVMEKGASAGATYTNSIGMEFVLIPAGTFQMGYNDGYDREKPVHSVTISKPFYLGKYEVTRREWKAVMGSNPSRFEGDNRPVESVSWDDVQEFIKKLNAKEGGDKYRLPTEAEWEYACRAGTTTNWYFGDNENLLGDYAWYRDNSGNETKPVGQKKPNAFGLYDMHGNVWEWCQDWYGSYESGNQTDPQGPVSGSRRVSRGGSWRGSGSSTRAAFRYYGNLGYGYGTVGFRLLRLQ
jgi:formylglycine-generating enzyme required for sulfatase activity